jgi:hypothetical protein
MTEQVITLLFAAFFIWVIYRWNFFEVPEFPRWYFAAVYLLKFLAGITLGILFIKYFNGGDTYTYFENACRLHELALSNPTAFLKVMAGSNAAELQPFYNSLGLWKSYELFDFDAQTIIRINALIRFVSFGIYEVHVLFFSFFSLLGTMAFYRMMRRAAWHNHRLLFTGLFLFPSLMFWSSGILKEGILILAMGIFFMNVYLLLRFGNSFRSSYMFMLIAMFLMLMVKTYVLILLIPGVAAWIWAEKTGRRHTLIKFAITHAVYFLLLFHLHYLIPEINMVKILYDKQYHSIVFADYMQSRSIIHPPVIEPSVSSILMRMPAAWWSTFTQPLIVNAHTPFAWLSAAENLLLIACMIIAVVFSRKVPQHAVPLAMLSVFFVFMFYVLVGFTATTAGSLVRFKIPAYPFLFFLLTLMFDKNKLFRFSKRKAEKQTF